MKTVKWKAQITRAIECPDYKPDPYTGEYPPRHCLVYHSETVTIEKAQNFETEEEAREFIRNAPPSCSNFEIF